jgi:pyruvate kinase
MRKTKIVCTLGPASRDEKTVEELIKSGMNVARLNFSHGEHAYHKETIDIVKKVRKKLAAPVAILLDTKGPEIRLGMFENSSVLLKDGDSFTLTANDVLGNESIASISYKELPSQLSVGNTVLINDGNVRLEVESIDESDIHCKVVRGGEISNRKGINIPRVHLDMPFLSDRDKADLIFGIENDVDFIAASFVRCADDIITMRKFVDFHGGHDIKIISKIESVEGIENFDEILRLSDGIMIARGDMGAEVEFEMLPGIQKRCISKCYRSGKMVITATQMIESMIKNPRPTRAEITDVANAVFDGTSAVMLSGETAVGKYPIEVVKVMAKIAEQAEKDAFEMNFYKGIDYDLDFLDTTNAICDAACTTARDIKASAIVALTKYGQTARSMSKFRPAVPIVAATPVEKTYYQLSLSWGVYPVLAQYQKTSEELLLHAADCAKLIDVAKDGDRVVIAAGIPLDMSGSTNLIKVSVVGERT